MSDKIISLQEELNELTKVISRMNPKHYTVQSEYHRLMYSYTLKRETIEYALKAISE